jgi:hypothetical protein
MIRMHSAFAATVLGVSVLASPLALWAQTPTHAPAQTVQAPPMTQILAGKKFTPPIKGQADVEFIKPVTNRVKDMVVTKIEVKNISTGPIPRLTVSETWYRKDGGIVTGSKGFINGLLQPGEVKTIEIETPYDKNMSANNFNFTHANGSVKPHQVKSFDAPKEAAPKAPAARKK